MNHIMSDTPSASRQVRTLVSDEELVKAWTAIVAFVFVSLGFLLNARKMRE